MALAASPVRAEPRETDEPPGTPDEAPEERTPRRAAAEGRVKVAVMVEPVKGLKPALLEKLGVKIERALRKNPRLKMVNPDQELASFGGDLPTETIDEAKKALKQGYRKLDEGDFRGAIPLLRNALVALGKIVAYAKKSQLVQAQFGLALAYFHTKARAQAEQMLLRLFTWRRKVKLDADSLPKPFIELVQSVRARLPKLPTANLDIQSVPAGAKAYLNGRYVGLTPVSLEDVPVGGHFLTLRKRGWLKAGEEVTLVAGRKTLTSLSLKQSPKYALLEQALTRTWEDLGKPRASNAMTELKTLLMLDQVVLVRPAEPTAEGVKVDVCLYDLRTLHLLKRVTVTLPAKSLKAEALAATLYAGVRYDGTLPDPGTEKVGPAVRRRPIYKQWWFWVSIGVAVAGAVTGITVPLALRKETGPPEGFHGVNIRF
jgi:hypothetical protein